MMRASDQKAAIIFVLALLGLLGAISGCAPSRDKTIEAQFEDLLLAGKVRNRLEDHPRLHPYAIEVSAADGVVMLTGVVDSRETRTKAEEIAHSVPGVKSVINRLSTR